jgi:hypothetical protein
VFHLRKHVELCQAVDLFGIRRLCKAVVEERKLTLQLSPNAAKTAVLGGQENHGEE